MNSGSRPCAPPASQKATVSFSRFHSGRSSVSGPPSTRSIAWVAFVFPADPSPAHRNSAPWKSSNSLNLIAAAYIAVQSGTSGMTAIWTPILPYARWFMATEKFVVGPAGASLPIQNVTRNIRKRWIRQPRCWNYCADLAGKAPSSRFSRTVCRPQNPVSGT